jgi:hydroxymethylpyrimidine/phosphomethylpyrimidine kinase
VTPPRVLAIAGSDSGGGAGIQADLKAFARCGAHGMTAITAITAQNTVGVSAIYPLPPEAILAQVSAVAEDIGIDAVKVGMLGNLETIEAVEQALDLVGDVPIVVDPVMVAESGAVLLEQDARVALASRILPRAAVVTPNLPEARVLAGAREGKGGAREDKGGDRDAEVKTSTEGADRDAEAKTAAEDGERTAATTATAKPDASTLDGEALTRAVHALGPRAVVVTGGHRQEGADLFFDGSTFLTIPGERHPDGAAHGSGCTHSSALAAHLALGFQPEEAARRARVIASDAVRDGLRQLGSGAGPVDVFGLGR